MKKIVFALAFVFCTSFGFAQTSVSGNKITSKEVAPQWPGCNESKLSAEDCFNQKLAQHIQKNFKFPAGYTKADKGSKVIVTFLITKKGRPKIEKITGGRKILQEEAKRNILTLPTMKPGTLHGKPVEIQYQVPFHF